ncbi:MAG: HEAT repeat domain-containing protein [Gemmataceae bacterium]
MPDNDLSPLLDQLASEQPEERVAAVRALAEHSPSEPVVAALVQALGDIEPTVRVEASRGIKQMGGSAVPFLIAALQDDNLALRRHAAMMLGTLGVAASEAVPALAEQTEDPNVGEEAERALRRIQKAMTDASRAADTGGVVISWVVIALFIGLQVGGTPFLFEQTDKKAEKVASGIALGWGVIGTLFGAVIGGARWGRLGVLGGGLGFGLAGSIIGTAIGYVVGKALSPLVGCLW